MLISILENKSLRRNSKMIERFNTYQDLKAFRERNLLTFTSDHLQLNQFHDQLMRKVVQIAITQVHRDQGTPPTPFTFFVMGSAGRFEQGACSDQDHGIVYGEGSTDTTEYYHYLGNEITKGLEIVGYKRCDGNVMGSNPLWCKSEEGWEEQINHWITEQDWESIRHLLIFMDARNLVGDVTSIERLKELVFNFAKESPFLLQRMFENTLRMKKGLGLLGQILKETHGNYSGMVNLKETAFIPYVNAIRLLSIQEKIKATATLDRIEQLSQFALYQSPLRNARTDFLQLLKIRLSIHGTSTPCDYDAGSYINTKRLSTEKQQELKKILRNVFHLHRQLKTFVDKGS
jgi:CBS domain-containing protein